METTGSIKMMCFVSGGYILLRIKDKYVPSAIIPVQIGHVDNTQNIIHVGQIRNGATRFPIGMVLAPSGSQIVARSIRIFPNRIYWTPYSWMG